MKNDFILEILDKKRSVREIIDEAVGSNPMENSENEVLPDQSETVQHLFVRRFSKNADKPYYKAKVKTLAEALKIFFDWVDEPKYLNERIEVWTSSASDAKKFYRFCLKNRSMLEGLWKSSSKIKRYGLKWPVAFKRIQEGLKPDSDFIEGPLEPFNIGK